MSRLRGCEVQGSLLGSRADTCLAKAHNNSKKDCKLCTENARQLFKCKVLHSVQFYLCRTKWREKLHWLRMIPTRASFRVYSSTLSGLALNVFLEQSPLYSLVQWNWFSDVTWCTRDTCIQWRQRTNFTALGCTHVYDHCGKNSIAIYLFWFNKSYGEVGGRGNEIWWCNTFWAKTEEGKVLQNDCFIASNAMARTQTIICFSVREPGAALSPLAIRFECVHISVFC